MNSVLQAIKTRRSVKRYKLDMVEQVPNHLNSISEQEMNKILSGLPFEIHTKSLQTKKIYFKRLMMLLNTKVGAELLTQIKDLSQTHGNIILKEENMDSEVFGYVDKKKPQTIVLSSAIQNDHQITSTLAHEIRHVIQHHHPDTLVLPSLEDGAKRLFMEELGGRLTNILFESDMNIDTPRANLFKSYKQSALDSGLNEAESEKNARTKMAMLYLTGGKDYEGNNPKLKKEFSNWKNFLLKFGLRNTARHHFTTDTDAPQRHQNYMNYLCDNMGFDRSILHTINHLYDNHRCITKNGSLEKIHVDYIILERFQNGNQTSIHETEEFVNGEKRCIIQNGKLRQLEKYTAKKSVVTQFDDFGNQTSKQQYAPQSEKFDAQGLLIRAKPELKMQINDGQSLANTQNLIDMQSLLKRLKTLTAQVQSLRQEVAQIRATNPQQHPKMNDILCTQTRLGKERISTPPQNKFTLLPQNQFSR